MTPSRFRRIHCLSILGAILSGLLSVPAFAQVEIVVVADGERAANTQLYSAQARARFEAAGQSILSVEKSPLPDKQFPYTHVIVVPDSAAAKRVMADIKGKSGIANVQFNYSYVLDAFTQPMSSAARDPFADSLEHLVSINALDLNVPPQKNTPVVGLVDTGIYFDHPDLAANVFANPAEDLNGNGIFDEADLNGIDDDGNGYIDDVAGYDFVDRRTAEMGDYSDRDPDASDDGSGHGTTVAGVVAAVADNDIGIRGVAPLTKILPLRAFGTDGRGDDLDIAAAIVYAADSGVDVLNLSFGNNYFSPLMLTAIQYAQAAGVVVVASAGNLGGDDPHYPSDYDGVISVAWLNREGVQISSRGTHGAGLDLGAPGSQIFTTQMPQSVFNGSDEMYGRVSGSSISAPMVSGAAALIKGQYPDLGPEDIRTLIVQSATDIDEVGWDHRTGAGNLNVRDALALAAPAEVGVSVPAMDAGVTGDRVAIVGTVVHPSLLGFQLQYTIGTEDLDSADWINIGNLQTGQLIADTLALWNIGSLVDSVYTLRLTANVSDAADIEQRYRVYVDNTAPDIEIVSALPSLHHKGVGFTLDIISDDETTVTVTPDGRPSLVSDRVSRRHGIHWEGSPLATLTQIDVNIVVTNRSGLATTIDTTVPLLLERLQEGLLLTDAMWPNSGYILPASTDFDNDGLPEVVLNQFQDGTVGDTLFFLEFDGQALRPASFLIANVIPRDIGDTDSDGLTELLTQVGAATIIFEQSDATSFPNDPILVDTTGLSDPLDPEAVWGTQLVNLDDDPDDELLSHNGRQFRIHDLQDSQLVLQAVLANPTSTSGSEVNENLFGQPKAVVLDINQNGNINILVGDTDGDLILYERTSGSSFEVIWTHETNRYDAGDRFTVLDASGDGNYEIVTYTHNWLNVTTERIREPDYATVTVFTVPVGGSPNQLQQFSLPGEINNNGTFSSGDLDGDGAQELVVANAPDLFVMDWDPASSVLVPIAYTNTKEFGGLRSPGITNLEMLGNRSESFVYGTVNGGLVHSVVDTTAIVNPAPSIRHYYVTSDSTAQIYWATAGLPVDSTTVYRSPDGQDFDPIQTTADFNASIVGQVTSEVAVAAWRGGAMSSLSRPVKLQPHVPAHFVGARSDANHTELEFSDEMQATDSTAFAIEFAGSREIVSPLFRAGGRQILLPIPIERTGNSFFVSWENLLDNRNGVVGDSRIGPVAIPSPGSGFHITSWEKVDAQTIRIYFSRDVAADAGQDLSQYSLDPHGAVTSVGVDPENDNAIIVSMTDVAIEPTGLNVTLTISGLHSRDGLLLDEKGSTIRLVQSAISVENAYVFPNPVVVSSHGPRLTIASVPLGSEIAIINANGALVKSVVQESNIEAFRWDLRDSDGQPVPSGLYIIRINNEHEDVSTVVKAVIIR